VVRNLIRDRIHSIEQLETLLLLRAEPERSWKSGEIAEALRFTEGAAELALDTLSETELVEAQAHTSPRTFRYAPRTRELSQQVDGLAECYQTFRVETLVLISTNAIHRVRSHALNTFAEAFRLRGPKKDG
jgi:hypothetical protein